MSTILFSIIIPLRKIGEGVVLETLPAIEAQTYTNFEVFLLPDDESGSDKKILRTYPWLHILPTHTKKMPGDKRDVGAQYARGDILAFLDDDALPVVDWLEKAAEIFTEKDDVVALGGPGLLPQNAGFTEQVIDTVLTSWFTSGSFAYRFTPMAPRFVDDFPSMNLMMRREIFLKLGGFNTQHWPGEDSKLLNKLMHDECKQVFYHPDVAVYHHRRADIWGHLKQYKNYGYHRGMFMAEGDENSQHFTYILPSLITIYLLLYLSGLPRFIPTNSYGLYQILAAIPIMMYGVIMIGAAIEAYIKTKKVLIMPGTLLLVPLTHMSYGTFFIYGYLKAKWKLFWSGF